MANDNIPSRCDWFSQRKDSVFDDKEILVRNYMTMFFTRTNTMFEFDGLPETIPKEDFEVIKQTFGSATIIKDNEKLYAVYGKLGGIYNEYYHPTKSVVANPYLKLSKTFTIDEDCVVIRNDLFYEGLFTLNRKYAELLAECDISFRKCLMNIRVDNVIVSEDESTDASIKLFFESVKKGDFAYITSKKFMDDALMQIHDVAKNTSNPLKDLIETRNYIDGCWWIEIGLNANANMKRESLNDAEISADDKTMIPLVNQMLDEEIKGWEKVNKMFGTNISVKLSSVWNKMKKEVLDETPDEPIKEDEKIDIEEGGDSDEKND